MFGLSILHSRVLGLLCKAGLTYLVDIYKLPFVPVNTWQWVIMWGVWLAWWLHQMETFSALPAICAGNSPVPVSSPHKGQWRGALMFTLICARINGWVNNRGAGDLRRHRCHYDVIVMEEWPVTASVSSSHSPFVRELIFLELLCTFSYM